MALEKLPSGTRGARTPPRLLVKLLMPLATKLHRRQGDRFRDFDVLYLHTVGAKSGQPRSSTVARLTDDKPGVLVVASYGGAQHHPAWYYNVVAHPERVSVEYGGRTRPVTVVQLAGDERTEAWKHIVAQSPQFGGYESKTDRELPVLRLVPVEESAGTP
jgi:deazaflavin-dependent oxidoreductase (nitroreductase family)